MKKNYNMYDFTYYNPNEYNSKTNKIKNSLIVIIIVLTLVVLLVYQIFFRKDKQITTVSSVVTLELEEQKKMEEERKEEEARLEAERIEQERIQKEEEERKAREAKLPKLTNEGIQNIENIYHSEEKRVFLTFDDGPSNVTHQILDTLKENDIKATFFVLGCNVKIFPETTKRNMRK